MDRIYGFDWLRPFLVLLVIATHLGFNRLLAVPGSVHASDVLNFNVFSIAVPSFLIVSFYLQLFKKESLADFLTRWQNIFFLYLFWSFLWYVYAVRNIPSNLGVWELMARGGGWVFYFFFVLLVLSPVVHLIRGLRYHSCVIIASLLLRLNGAAYYLMHTRGNYWVATDTHWWAINFLATPFIARALVLCEVTKSRLALLALLFFAALSMEWLMYAHEATYDKWRLVMPEYTRISPFIGAAIVVALVLRIKQKPPSWMQFLSRNSLGIFCLHCFVIRGVVFAVMSMLSCSKLTALCLAIPLLMGSLAVASEFIRKVLASRLI